MTDRQLIELGGEGGRCPPGFCGLEGHAAAGFGVLVRAHRGKVGHPHQFVHDKADPEWGV